MLLWLQKKLPKVANLWIKLIGIATGMHIVLLFALFFIYKGDYSSLNIEINSNIDKDALVVFLPFQKKAVNKSSGKKGTGRKSTASKATQQKTAQQKAPSTKQTPTVAKVATIAPTKVPTSIVDNCASCKKKPNKTVKKKTLAKKDAKKSEKKVTPAPVAQKKEVPQEKVKPQETPKKEIVEEKKESPKIEEVKKEEPIIKDVAQDVMPTNTLDETSNDANDQNIRYIGQADLDAMCIQESLSMAISQHWKPPVGVSKDRVCELTIVIDWQGNIKDIKVQKSSGAAMYDVSARSAAKAAQYPQALWGKTCTITFKQ